MQNLEIPSVVMTRNLSTLKWDRVDDKKTRGHYAPNALWQHNVRELLGNGLYQSLGTFAQMHHTQRMAKEMSAEISVSYFVMTILGRLNRFVETRRENKDPYSSDIEDFIQQLNNLDQEQHLLLYDELWNGIKYEYNRQVECLDLADDDDDDDDDDMSCTFTLLRRQPKQSPSIILPTVESQSSVIYDSDGGRRIKRSFPFD